MFKPRSRTFDDGWHWRHEIAPSPAPARFGDEETELDRSWRELLIIHTSFRSTDQGEYGQIVRALREIERLFLERPELSEYYAECHRAPGKVTGKVWHGEKIELYVPEAQDNKIRHIAAIQARFMEDVYFVLQLSRFANALDNRGWMNLFRSWGQSVRFNVVWNSMVPTFTEEFVEFYKLYIRYYPGPIEQYPIPHPWDPEEARKDPRSFGDEISAEMLPGVYLDSGIQVAAPAGGTGGAPLPSPGSESHGVAEEETKTLSKDNWPVYQDRGEDTGSGSSPAPNN